MQIHRQVYLVVIWLACITILNQFVLAGAPEIQPGVPMKSAPVHLVRRSDAGRQRTTMKFKPMNSIQLRFIEADKSEYYDACHHVDMNVELKSDDGSRTIEALNPFAFQHAVKSISCANASSQLDIELDPVYAKQVRRWNFSPRNVFGIVIPHDFVDLKKNKACYTGLDSTAKKWIEENPMETVVKLVKDPRFLDAKSPNTVSFTIVKTDIWSQMNRVQSVHINHRPLDTMLSKVLSKRSTAYEQGPMWDFEHDLSSGTKAVDEHVTAENVHADLDRSSVKGYAQADMAWKQTCIKGIFTGKMRCANWGISNSKISGVTEIKHQTQITVKNKQEGVMAASADGPPLLTLTNISITTPSFDLMAPIPLLGFSVPGVFDMGANVGLGGTVSLAVIVQATEDLLVNTGSSTSCPWIIDWNGSFTKIPTIQFGTCSKPDTPKSLNRRSIDNRASINDAFYFGSDPATASKSNTRLKLAATEGGSRETAEVRIGMTVSPSLTMGLKVFGISTLSAGINAPIRLGIHTYWDTDSTSTCPADHVALSAEGGASLNLVGGFFGFSKSIPVVQSPALETPAVCIPH
ncbi:hypothetical protein BX616_008869 [Lobosporangium transversale]|nr:hypothetical protein BX616_008869 [Lobosporangium transversale]